MKKYAFLLAVLTFLVSGCDTGTKADEEINPDKLYFFYSNGCPHCHDALEYINKKYPDLKMTMVNVGNPGGFNLMVKCARKFNLGDRIGTPLFCMGRKHLMGWAPQNECKFDMYVRPFVKE